MQSLINFIVRLFLTTRIFIIIRLFFIVRMFLIIQLFYNTSIFFRIWPFSTEDSLLPDSSSSPDCSVSYYSSTSPVMFITCLFCYRDIFYGGTFVASDYYLSPDFFSIILIIFTGIFIKEELFWDLFFPSQFFNLSRVCS